MSNQYNFIAHFYDAIAKIVFGKSISEAQNQWLNYLPEKGEVLFVGGGSGTTLKEIVKLKPGLKITYVEASSKMKAKSKRKLTIEENDRVHFMNKKIEEIEFDKTFDAILTFFFLDLFPKPKGEIIFHKLDRNLKVNGQWFMVDFNNPKNNRQRLIEKAMFAFFKLTTGIESNSIYSYVDFFENANYDLLAKESFYDNFIFSNLYSKSAEEKNWHAN